MPLLPGAVAHQLSCIAAKIKDDCFSQVGTNARCQNHVYGISRMHVFTGAVRRTMSVFSHLTLIFNPGEILLIGEPDSVDS